MVINKTHKIYVASQRCCLYWSPNVCVNIIKNHLCLVCGCLELHLILFPLKTQYLHNSSLHVLIPFNSFLLRSFITPRSPICPNRICYKAVQSNSGSTVVVPHCGTHQFVDIPCQLLPLHHCQDTFAHLHYPIGKVVIKTITV